jgi:hypothetical protein
MLSFNKLVGKFLLEKQRWKARFRKAKENEALLFKGWQFGTRGYQGVVKKFQYNDKGNFNVDRSCCNNCCELGHWVRDFLAFEGINN